MLNYREIETSAAANLAEALELHLAVTGSNFYEGFTNVQARTLKLHEDGNHGLYNVCDDTGDIYFVFNCPDGLQILHKLSIDSCISDGGFREATIDEKEICIFGKGWGNTPANRDIFVKERMIVTSIPV